MKFLTRNSTRFRAALALLMMVAFFPVTSLWHAAEAKPPRHAPAYGYRRKTSKRYEKRTYRRPEYRRRTVTKRSDRRPEYRRREYRRQETKRTYRSPVDAYRRNNRR